MPRYEEGRGISKVIFAIMFVCSFTILFKSGQVQQAQLHCTVEMLLLPCSEYFGQNSGIIL